MDSKKTLNLNLEIELELSTHIDCLSREKVRASLVVNLEYAQRIASLNFKKAFVATRLITFVPGGYSRPRCSC